MNHDELRQACITLYGDRLRARQYHKLLAADLECSEVSVRKYWYALRPISGPVGVAVKLMVWKARMLRKAA